MPNCMKRLLKKTGKYLVDIVLVVPLNKYRKLYIINQTTIHNFLDLPIDSSVYILVIISASVCFGIPLK